MGTNSFRPSLLATLVLALLAAGFAVLGVWQLQRADWKAELIETHRTAAEMSLEQAIREPAPFARINARGRLLHEQSIFLDNQMYQGQLGVHVYTPFARSGEPLVLVNRGWLPLPRPRAELAPPGGPDGPVDLRGRLREPPRPGLYLGEAEALQSDRWPQLVTYLDTEKVADALGREVSSWVVQLDAASGHGFEASNWPVVNFGPDRHLGYAWTWFTMVLTIFIIWIILGVMRARRQT